jgi:RNA polymerase sigma factor (sigma-70 family)
VSIAGAVPRPVAHSGIRVTFWGEFSSKGYKGGLIHESEEISALYQACGSEIWRALLVVAGGRADLAEEATAEAFARLLVHRDRVRDPRAWLYRTGFRIVVQELRRERHSGPLVRAETGAHELSLSPALTEALKSLSAQQRLAVFLTYQADLPLREVARLSGSSVAAVKVRLHRARDALKATLLKEDAGV